MTTIIWPDRTMCVEIYIEKLVIILNNVMTLTQDKHCLRITQCKTTMIIVKIKFNFRNL